MITAKQAKDGTKVERYIKEKCDEIEETIKLSMDIGLAYLKYSGHIPPSVQNMLRELGYKVIKVEDPFTGNRFVITWGDTETDVKCN